MRRRLQVLMIAVAAVLGGTAVAAPAQATVYTSTISFNASPEPLTAGASVTLSGTAGYKNSLNAGTVRFYFRKWNTSTYTLITSTTAVASGTFSKTVKQTTSGYWKAVYAGNSVRRPVTSTVDYVEAKAWRTVSSVRFTRSDVGDYTGPVSTWYTDRSAAVSVRATCDEPSDFNFLYVVWNGKPAWGYSAASFDFGGRAAIAKSQFVYPDEKSGYIEVTTQAGCSWTVTITQRVRAYVKV
jgi:hypothetical protein